MTRKKTPEFIDIPETTLDEIKARVISNALLEEDKKILLVIVTAYAWLQRQLESTKITIGRLKKLFGFSTEKREKKKSKDSNTSLEDIFQPEGLLETQALSLNKLQGIGEEPPEKK